MSMEQVKEKILKEAENDARRIFEKGRYDGRTQVTRAKRLAEQIAADEKARTTEEVYALKSGKKSVSELEARKMRLNAKQQVISRAFEDALAQIADMEQEDYVDFLVRRVKEANEEGGELLFNAKDRETIGARVAARVNEDSPDKQVTVSDELIRAKGGFVLKNGPTEINSTLETMVAGIREETMPEVVGILFRQ